MCLPLVMLTSLPQMRRQQQLGADAVTLAVEILLELISSQLGQQTLAQDIRHAAHIAASEVSRIGEPAHYLAARIVECVESNQSVLKEGEQSVAFLKEYT